MPVLIIWAYMPNLVYLNICEWYIIVHVYLYKHHNLTVSLYTYTQSGIDCNTN